MAARSCFVESLQCCPTANDVELEFDEGKYGQLKATVYNRIGIL